MSNKAIRGMFLSYVSVTGKAGIEPAPSRLRGTLYQK